MYHIKDKSTEKLYLDLMDELKKVNKDAINLRNSKQYRIGLVLSEIIDDLKGFKIKKLSTKLKKWINGRRDNKFENNCKIDDSEKTQANYFSDKKVAIYTAVFGNYDNVPEPLIKPDNCDYFIFTDQTTDFSNSLWQKKNIPKKIEGLNNVEKNRYIKMHPHEFFEDYEYSIYIDGNIQVITDLTEYINKLGDIGIGVHKHKCRTCVYDELKIIVKNGKDNKKNADKHLKYLIETNMPKNYGLLECGMIVRRHNDELCVEIMNSWWDEFSNYSKRDQISLPHVLFIHNIPIESVVISKESIYDCSAIRFYRHK